MEQFFTTVFSVTPKSLIPSAPYLEGFLYGSTAVECNFQCKRQEGETSNKPQDRHLQRENYHSITRRIIVYFFIIQLGITPIHFN